MDPALIPHPLNASGLILLAYLLGSIPFGYLFVQRMFGKDIRQHGSGNIGMINVFRVCGVVPALLTLLCDAGKAAAAVWIAARYVPADAMVAAVAFSALVGHAFSLWFLLTERRFSEGKCVASALGLVAALPIVGLLPWWVPVLTIALWWGTLGLGKVTTGTYPPLSVATLTATGLLPLLVLASNASEAIVALSAGMSLLIILRHKRNLQRLRTGTEPAPGRTWGKEIPLPARNTVL
jgi:acyl phosphate:glycerol-3-phosphate acyltransferase